MEKTTSASRRPHTAVTKIDWIIVVIIIDRASYNMIRGRNLFSLFLFQAVTSYRFPVSQICRSHLVTLKTTFIPDIRLRSKVERGQQSDSSDFYIAEYSFDEDVDDDDDNDYFNENDMNGIVVGDVISPKSKISKNEYVNSTTVIFNVFLTLVYYVQ